MRTRSKFCVLTLGCKVNQYESEALEKALEDRGMIRIDPRSVRGKRLPADRAPNVLVVNTCAVTGKAAMQSRQAIRRAVRSNPDALVIATGCCAQTQPEEIAEIPGVGAVVGHSKKAEIPGRIESLSSEKSDVPFMEVEPAVSCKTFRDMPATPSGSRTRAFLKVQDGCDARCTYCIVPRARGASRSLPPKKVLEKMETLEKAGAREIVLTGIHLGAYGKDLDPAADLAGLLSRIRDEDPVARVRLSSVEPMELDRRLLELAFEWKRFCPHFHIPLQSGDDEILKRMNRPYSSGYFRDLVFGIKAALPDAAVGIDCLAGFPGETEKAFENTLRLVEEIPAAYLHVFPFSPRKGTPAFAFNRAVSLSESKRRCEILRALGEKKKRRFYESFAGRRLEVLVEERRESSTGMLRGTSANYVPVFFRGSDELENSIVPVRIEEILERSGKLAAAGRMAETRNSEEET